MSDTSTLNAAPEISRGEISQLLLKAISRAEDPQSLSQILKDIPASVRPPEDVAMAVLQDEVRANRVFEYPVVRGHIQFWRQPRAVFARRLLLRNVARGPKRQSDLLREVGKLSPVKGVSKAELKRIFESLRQEGLIYKLPPYIGTRTDLFGSAPADPSDYLKDALQKLSKKLGLTEQELMDSYKPSFKSTPEGHAGEHQQAASGPATVRDERIIEAMKELNPDVTAGAMVSIADLRRQLSIHLPGEEFDRALLNESASGNVAIHLFDRPQLVSEEERRSLLCDEKGNYYNTVSLRGQ